MDFQILGPLEVVDDGRSIEVVGGKQQALLALLVIHANETLSTDRIAEEVWGGAATGSAKTVQVQVSRLRKALANGSNGSNGILVTRDHGYELRIDPDQIDAHRFERLVAEGRNQLAAGGTAAAARTLERALALWRGKPLTDLPHTPFAEREAERLAELHVAAREDLFEAKLALGRHAEVLAAIDACITEHPYRERLRAQKMLALYRADRQADALQVYQDARLRLVSDLGIEPGERLRRLEESVLAQDSALALPREVREQALRESVARTQEQRAGLRTAESDLAENVQGLRALDAAPATDVVACPFKGLAAFDVDDADVFFGRERLVAELVARLVGAPLLGIVGPSGSGKSSALRAGLLAALAGGVLPGSERWSLELLRPGEHPLHALGAMPATEGRRVIAVDQFEEVFTSCPDEAERAAFVAGLIARARDPRTLVIVAIRADFYGRCAAHPELARALAASHVLVGPMRRDELRRAIERPTETAGLEIDPELVDALIADVEREPGALPLLSTTLLELWRDRDGRRLRLRAYEHSGGVRGAVARLAEGAYRRLDDAQRVTARRILMRLAGEGEGDAAVRRRVPLAELGHDPSVTAVLSILATERLVTVGEGEVEVAHEALLREWPRLRGWLEEDAQGRRLHRHLSVAAREWDAGGRDPGELYRGARLASVLDWSAAHDDELNATERAFVAAGRGASERSQRRLRAVLAGVATLLVLALAAGVIALSERGNARDEARAADAQSLGARALVESDFDRALLLARQGVALDDSVQTRSNLLATLLKAPAALGVMSGGHDALWSMALSPDERTLAVGDEFGRVQLFDAASRRLEATFQAARDGSSIYRLAFSPDGRRLALAHGFAEALSSVSIVDVPARRFIRTLPPGDKWIGPMRFERGGKVLALEIGNLFPPGPLTSYRQRFDLATGQRIGASRRLSSVPALAWPTADGRRLVVSGEDGTTIRSGDGATVLRRFARGFRDADYVTGLSADGRTLAAGGHDGSLRLMDLRTGRVRTASGRHNAPVGPQIVFTRDGRRVITSGRDGSVIVWNVARAAVEEEFTGHGGAVRGLAVSADGGTLYSAGADGRVIIWDLTGRRRLGRPFWTGGAAQRGFPRWALSGDDQLLAFGGEDGQVTFVDARTFRRLRTVRLIHGRGALDQVGDRVRAILGMRFLPGRHLIAVASFGGVLAIIDADSGRVLHRLRGHVGVIYTPGIDAKGTLMVTGSDDQSIRWWSLPDGRPLGRVLLIPTVPSDVQLSPDGRWVTIIDGSNTLQLADARTHRVVRRVRGPDGLFFARFSPDGRFVAVGDVHGRAEVWSTATWRPVTRPLSGHTGKVSQAEISRDDRTLATGSTDGTVRLWDIASEQPIGAPLRGLAEQEVIPIFTPDDRGLIAAYNNGRGFRWDIDPLTLQRQACRVAGRRLTRAEWEEFLPRRPYEPAC